jgi:NUMOD4 motif
MRDQLPPSEEGELWLDVVGYEGRYQVSNRGRVWSVPRQVQMRNRWGPMTRRPAGGRLLVLSLNPAGYSTAHLARGGEKRTWQVHQLVMRAFVGQPPEGHEVCHGPAGRLVNHWPENLRYDTRSANHADKRRDGTSQAGERLGCAKLSAAEVIEIRELYESTKHLRKFDPERWSMTKLAAKYDVDRCTIGRIVQGKSWAPVDV